jgi:hypothetical protein
MIIAMRFLGRTGKKFPVRVHFFNGASAMVRSTIAIMHYVMMTLACSPIR